MRSVSGEELSRRAPAIQDATAEISSEVDRISSPIEPYSPSTISYVPSLSSSPSIVSFNLENTPLPEGNVSHSPLPEDVVQEAPAAEPTPASGTSRARKRWSEEMNKFIWRTYLIATKLNTNKVYLQQLHLAIELKRQWQAQTIHIVPIVISSTGIIPKSLKRSLEILQIPQFISHILQKAVILNTCRITRKFLTTSPVSSTYSIS